MATLFRKVTFEAVIVLRFVYNSSFPDSGHIIFGRNYTYCLEMSDSDIRKRSKSNSAVTVAEDQKKVTPEAEDKPAIRSPNRNFSLRVLSRIVVFCSFLVVVYFSTKGEKFIDFAKQAESIPGRGKIIDCSTQYRNELGKYEGCFPRDCGRYVTDQIISPREVDDLIEIAKKGLKLGGSSGGASILDLHSGALSKGEHFVNIYKINEGRNLFTDKDFNTYRVVKEKIKYAISHHFGVNPEKLYLTHPTFFSEITSAKAVTVHDEYWHPHVDKETYKSFHYTSLLYLSDQNIDFKGGRFVFVDARVNSTVEPRKARLSMFTSGAENLHYVEKVSSGIRRAMTISFTCDKQYAIEDPSVSKYAA